MHLVINLKYIIIIYLLLIIVKSGYVPAQEQKLDDCSRKTTINQYYIKNKNLINGTLKCFLIKENKTYLELAAKLKQESSKFGAINIQKLANLRDGYLFNLEILTQIKTSINCKDKKVIFLINCLKEMQEDEDTRYKSLGCYAYQGIMLALDEFKEYCKEFKEEVKANSCPEINYNFDKILHPDIE
jgi:hypothetical protein